MPKIGLRIIKSALAVFLCFAADLLRGGGIPFYSAIAALLCMQPDIPSSLRTGINRMEGTLIGGLAGMLLLLFEREFIPRDIPLLQYALVSLMIVPLLYITVLLQKTSASYITCVVFLSVTVSHGADVSPWLFARNRILDTLIGIVISLTVNAIPFLRPRLPEKSSS